MKRVYTKTGDKGTTGIHGGMRVPKDDIRIEANGCLDELNAVIGIVRSMLSAEDSWQELLHAVQRELMVVMSHVATPSGVVNPNPLSAAELTLRCEQEMDAMTVLLTWFDHLGVWAMIKTDLPLNQLPTAISNDIKQGKYAGWKIEEADTILSCIQSANSLHT